MILGDVYKAIMTRVGEVTDVKHFDEYKGQLEEPEQHDPFRFPAVFFEWQPGNPITIGEKRQQFDAVINLYIATEVIQKKASRDTTLNIDKALNHLNMVEAIHAKLQAFNGYMVSPNLNFGSLNRTTFNAFEGNVQTKNGYLKIHFMAYRTRIVLDGALTTYTPVTPTTLEVIQNMLPDED